MNNKLTTVAGDKSENVAKIKSGDRTEVPACTGVTSFL